MDRDAYLLHQVHPAKLATDVTAGVVSGWLMWHRRVPAALLAAFVPAAVASAVLMRRDLSGLRQTRRGRYVLAHMPPSAQAVRLAGQLVAWRSAYRHRPWGIVAGHLVVVAGWSYGLRNSFGFTFDPETRNLWETENGPECNDELNRIVKGGNYAWGPNETCSGAAPDPKPVAPSLLPEYKATAGPEAYAEVVDRPLFSPTRKPAPPPPPTSTTEKPSATAN